MSLDTVLVFNDQKQLRWNGDLAHHLSHTYGYPVEEFEHKCNTRWDSLSEDKRWEVLLQAVEEYLQRTGKKSFTE